MKSSSQENLEKKPRIRENRSKRRKNENLMILKTQIEILENRTIHNITKYLEISKEPMTEIKELCYLKDTTISVYIMGKKLGGRKIKKNPRQKKSYLAEESTPPKKNGREKMKNGKKKP